ncbi:MAG: tRNA-specific 2-thiouridylase MnmA [Parcubacteria group bacterium]|nr:tRNA-specific 2-thiouridylase MnmA [Parcubacteria group bacterium]
MNAIRGKRVFVGLSGGVDSAVSAALLKQAGANVTGVFIKGWYPPGMPCTWATDRRDAMRVAARLQIPFYTLDASLEYKQGVIDYLLSEYAAGRTPNPDVMCNREVKFGAFWRFAQKNNADFLATGHYAQQREGKLLRGIDESKDQSYFLWAVPKEVIARTLFPVGGLPKSETRVLAQKFNLPVAEKKDSQGICFLGSISVEDFLKEELGSESGKAVTEDGKEVGMHTGAVLHTLGERVALEKAGAGPWYVTKKDLKNNVLTVSHEQKKGNALTSIQLRDTNWLSDSTDTLEAQYRYHGPRVPGTLSQDLKEFIPTNAIEESVASGQSLVLYQGEVCVGGGIIS